MPTPIKIIGYGWIPDLPDYQDRKFSVAAPVSEPAGSLNVEWLPPVFNQGRLGSCTGASSARGWVGYLLNKEGQPHVMSPLFAYYNGRLFGGTTSSDSGASIRNVIKGVVKYGVCADELWPYDIVKFAVKPTDRAYKDAHFTTLDSYERIDSEGPERINAAKAAILDGHPIHFGFTVYENFESVEVARTGNMPMPSGDVVGGHAVWVWSYDNSRGFRIRNSWGPDWGIHGDFWMPFEYFQNPDLVSDIWVLKTVT
jgi:C1A family cysteine protease